MTVHSKAKQSFIQAARDTYPEHSPVLAAMEQFAVDGIDVNKDREKARLVVQHLRDILTTLKQSWNLFI